MKPSAGAMDTPIEIQYASSTEDPVYGTPGEATWRPLVVQAGSPTVAQYIWAQWEDLLPSRDERIVQGLAVGSERGRVRFRYRADITSDMRIVRRDGTDRVYSIIGGPAMLGRRERTEISVERIT